MIDGATSQVWGGLVEHQLDGGKSAARWAAGCNADSLWLSTPMNDLFVTCHPVRWQFQVSAGSYTVEHSGGTRHRPITAHFAAGQGTRSAALGALQDRLVKEMRLAEIAALEAANRFWKSRLAVLEPSRC